MNTSEDDISAGPQPRQSVGANGTRSKHGALARREYNLLASEAIDGVQPTRGRR